MAVNRDKPKFELIAKNEYITLKNPINRIYKKLLSYYLKLRGENIIIKKEHSKNSFTTFPIDKKLSKQIKLKTKVPKLKEIEISKNAGNYICNYSMLIIENYLRENKLKTEFYFIHIPKVLTKKQEKEILEFILN